MSLLVSIVASPVQECIKIHNKSVQEAEQHASEALQQHSRELEKHAAELAILRKQAQDYQQKLTDKEVQLSDVQCRMDESSALLERLQSAQETSREPLQELAAKDAIIVDLNRKFEAAISYRKKCVALEKECRQLRSLLQGLNGQPTCATSVPSLEATPPLPGNALSGHNPTALTMTLFNHLSQSAGDYANEHCLVQTTLHNAWLQPLSAQRRQRQEQKQLKQEQQMQRLWRGKTTSSTLTESIGCITSCRVSLRTASSACGHMALSFLGPERLRMRCVLCKNLLPAACLVSSGCDLSVVQCDACA